MEAQLVANGEISKKGNITVRVEAHFGCEIKLTEAEMLFDIFSSLARRWQGWDTFNRRNLFGICTFTRIQRVAETDLMANYVTLEGTSGSRLTSGLPCIGIRLSFPFIFTLFGFHIKNTQSQISQRICSRVDLFSRTASCWTFAYFM